MFYSEVLKIFHIKIIIVSLFLLLSHLTVKAERYVVKATVQYDFQIGRKLNQHILKTVLKKARIDNYQIKEVIKAKEFIVFTECESIASGLEKLEEAKKLFTASPFLNNAGRINKSSIPVSFHKDLRDNSYLIFGDRKFIIDNEWHEEIRPLYSRNSVSMGIIASMLLLIGLWKWNVLKVAFVSRNHF